MVRAAVWAVAFSHLLSSVSVRRRLGDGDDHGADRFRRRDRRLDRATGVASDSL